jgi:hypothetical protein
VREIHTSRQDGCFLFNEESISNNTPPQSHNRTQRQRQRHDCARVRARHEEVSAFLKIDRCAGCWRELAWEWVPPVELCGKVLAGTGIWRSVLMNDLCAACIERRALTTAKIAGVRMKCERLIALLGGERPFREFTFGGSS